MFQGDSASSIADTMAGATGIVPASPMPLTPIGLVGEGVSRNTTSMCGISVEVGRR